MKKIAIIGLGHFGQAFVERFKESGFEGDLLISRGRGTNAELVEAADVLILCVRPLQLAALCKELREPLKGHLGEKCVVTFSAATPAAVLSDALGQPALRAMSDLQFDQILSFPDERIRPLFSALSKNPLIELQDESKLDAFTILMACLSGVAAWQYLHRPAKAELWLDAYCSFIHARLGVPLALASSICAHAKMDPDPAETILRIATPGGITESLVEALGKNPELSFEDLYAAGTLRLEVLRAAIAASLKGE